MFLEETDVLVDAAVGQDQLDLGNRYRPAPGT